MSKFTKWLGSISSAAVFAAFGAIFVQNMPDNDTRTAPDKDQATHIEPEAPAEKPRASEAFATSAPFHYSGLPPQSVAQTPHLNFSSDFESVTLNPTLPKPPAQEVMDVYAYEPGSIPLNPFLVKALVEDPQAREYLREIKAACETNDLDWRMCANQIFRESNHFNPDVVSGKTPSGAGAIGIVQFTPDTAAEYGFTVEDVSDYRTAIPLYAQHMAHLRDYYDGDMIFALIAYNAGKGDETAERGVTWIRSQLDGPDATGADAMAFLEARYNALGNTSHSAYHVETRNYVNEILALNIDEWEHPQWVQTQNARFNDAYFVAGLENEANVLSRRFPIAAEPKIIALQAVASVEPMERSLRPRARPDDLQKRQAQNTDAPSLNNG